jgi:hypothetical protein
MALGTLTPSMPVLDAPLAVHFNRAGALARFESFDRDEKLIRKEIAAAGRRSEESWMLEVQRQVTERNAMIWLARYYGDPVEETLRAAGYLERPS